MYDRIEVEAILESFINIEYDIMCFLDVLIDLENYYDRDGEVQMAKRFHFVKTKTDELYNSLHNGIEALDNYFCG